MGHYACDMRPEGYGPEVFSSKKQARILVDEWMHKHIVCLSDSSYKDLKKQIKKAIKTARKGSK